MQHPRLLLIVLIPDQQHRFMVASLRASNVRMQFDVFVMGLERSHKHPNELSRCTLATLLCVQSLVMLEAAYESWWRQASVLDQLLRKLQQSPSTTHSKWWEGAGQTHYS